MEKVANKTILFCFGEAIHFFPMSSAVRNPYHSGKLSTCKEIDTDRLWTKGASVEKESYWWHVSIFKHLIYFPSVEH